MAFRAVILPGWAGLWTGWGASQFYFNFLNSSRDTRRPESWLQGMLRKTARDNTTGWCTKTKIGWQLCWIVIGTSHDWTNSMKHKIKTMVAWIAGAKCKIKTLADAPCQPMLSLGKACPGSGLTSEMSAVQIGTELLLHWTNHTVSAEQRSYILWL